MMHPTEGEMRAYQDGELPEARQAEVQSHLAACTRCRQRAGELATRSAWVYGRLSVLSPTQEALPARAARARLRSSTEQKEETVLHRLFRARYRPVWATAAAVAVLAVSLSFPQVRAAAGRLLQLFRVERITPVQVGVGIDEVPGEAEAYLARLESLLGSQVELEGLLEPVQVPDAEQAAELVGFPVRLPTALESAPKLTCQQGRTVRLTIERDRWQALLNEMGYGDFVLPESVDGGTVTIEIPDMAAAVYGQPSGDGIVLIQSRNPSVEVPPELDIDRMGEILLEALGMPSAEAAEFAGSVDWLTTLVIPVPRGAEYRTIPGVDGVSGVLFDTPSPKGEPRYTLVWLKDGIVYGLTGASDAAEATAIANSLP